MSETTLPPGWVTCALGDVRVDRGTRVVPSDAPDELFELFSIPSFPAGQAEVVPGAAIGSDKQCVEPGTVLVSKINPRINRVWQVKPRTTHRLIASTEWVPFFPVEAVEPQYLAYYLRQDDFRDYLASNVSGVGGSLMRVRPVVVERYPFRLPPLAEQRRIVAALEEHLSELDAAVAGLERAQANLSRLQHGVVQNAVDVALDEGADEKTLKQLAWSAGYGTSDRCTYEATGEPVLRIPNIVEGKIDLADLKFSAADVEFTADDAVRPGDLLIVRTNGSRSLIGRGAVVLSEPKRPLYFASYLIRYRLKDDPWVWRWVNTIWHSRYVRQRLESLAASSAGQYNLSVGKLDNVQVPIPSRERAEELANAVDAQLDCARRARLEVEAQIARAARLRQSILRAAFDGKLVPQDPTDEPAAVLLNRINAQHVAPVNAPRVRAKTKSTRRTSRK